MLFCCNKVKRYREKAKEKPNKQEVARKVQKVQKASSIGKFGHSTIINLVKKGKRNKLSGFPKQIQHELANVDKRLDAILREHEETYVGTEIIKDAYDIFEEQCRNKNKTEEKKIKQD